MLRRQTLFERGVTWAVITAMITIIAALWVGMVAGGIIPDPLGQAARGYTLTGYLLGFTVIVVGTLTFAYSLRKRGLQESIVGRGSMMSWLWAHVALGLIAINLSVLHAGFGVISYPVSSGKILFWTFAFLTLSGIVWRTVYAVVPKRAAARIGNYSAEAMSDRIVELTTEIEKVAAGRSAAFRQLVDWLGAAPHTDQELHYAVAQGQLPPDEQQAIFEVKVLADSRRRAEERIIHQKRYTRRQQLWRWIHVPLALSIVPLLFVHVLGATRAVTRLLPIGSQGMLFSSFAPSGDCRSCHRAVYDQWKHSMHAHAMRSPVMIAQSNQVAKEVLADVDGPDPKLICVNCHGPVGIALTKREQALLPLDGGNDDQDDLVNEGVGCVVCHQYNGAPSDRGSAGLTPFQKKYEHVGNTYFGPFDDPVGNAAHKSERGAIYDDPTRLCVACHNVVFDKNEDQRFDKGPDLVLQETTKEYDEYRENGGGATCLDCHMPYDKRSRAAESADLVFEQDAEAPKRKTRDHSFVAVDYPLDVPPEKDPQRLKRGALLRSAATLRLSSVGNVLTATIKNTGCGHNLPTGLAFARQMWLEIQAFDGSGRVIFSSGALAKNTDDLCDDGSMSDVFRGFMEGCTQTDRNLVNFQLKLVDVIDTKRDNAGTELRNEDGERIVIAAPNARESVLQRLTGGAVARRRPLDNALFTPMKPGEERAFNYILPFNAFRVEARLLFRSFGPYFLRAIAAGQPKSEKPRLAPLVKNLQIDEMARAEIRLR
ncbi:MAG: hypothetical protein KC731_41955 [Myxococcales bacterium]|nr:hypothetical protein [Myxococcales bacterium]